MHGNSVNTTKFNLNRPWDCILDGYDCIVYLIEHGLDATRGWYCFFLWHSILESTQGTERGNATKFSQINKKVTRKLTWLWSNALATILAFKKFIPRNKEKEKDNKIKHPWNLILEGWIDSTEGGMLLYGHEVSEAAGWNQRIKSLLGKENWSRFGPTIGLRRKDLK